MNKALIFKILLISACSSRLDNKKLNNDSLAKGQVKPASKHQEDGLENRILGVWTNGNTENVLLKISRDSIFCISHSTSYKYSLTGNSLKYSLTGNSLKVMYPDYPNYNYTAKISFNGDTLVMVSDEGTDKMWRFKK